MLTHSRRPRDGGLPRASARRHAVGKPRQLRPIGTLQSATFPPLSGWSRCPNDRADREPLHWAGLRRPRATEVSRLSAPCSQRTCRQQGEAMAGGDPLLARGMARRMASSRAIDASLRSKPTCGRPWHAITCQAWRSESDTALPNTSAASVSPTSYSPCRWMRRPRSPSRPSPSMHRTESLRWRGRGVTSAGSSCAIGRVVSSICAGPVGWGGGLRPRPACRMRSATAELTAGTRWDRTVRPPAARA
jgi:hypothetical protein